MNVLFQLIALGAIVSGGIVALWLLAGMTVKAARMFWLIRIHFPYLYGVSTMVVLFSMMLASGGQSWSIFLSLLFLFLVVLAVRLPDDLLTHISRWMSPPRPGERIYHGRFESKSVYGGQHDAK